MLEHQVTKYEKLGCKDTNDIWFDVMFWVASSYDDLVADSWPIILLRPIFSPKFGWPMVRQET